MGRPLARRKTAMATATFGGISDVRVGRRKTQAKGGSTACVVTLHGKSLRAVNIGDNGFILICGKKVIYQSPAQPYDKNRPYLLGKRKGYDGTEKAEEICLEVEDGSLIVAGTEGLFDNVPVDGFVDLIFLACQKNNNMTTPDPKHNATSLMFPIYLHICIG
ncbi:OLC1v1001494C1 [Oldenlandia corymbosa var. corymbosa]|uniref:Protein phosphatase n=1 Tax=Oldenlandia corymbosa var. corymbosa TaxID=529605 RepID=A0AAV1D7N7_OLDCO|nr:OLC1v1001494C1 [Oldenlandia corymbosa var. corymbosa]